MSHWIIIGGFIAGALLLVPWPKKMDYEYLADGDKMVSGVLALRTNFMSSELEALFMK